ncbi:MAG: bifunctional 3-(3-hydroxy-phenyl)propionate/3-hydroxycinnamic acid hydroxylase [Acidimicrobiia bacterium]|nr:bifunctional 3-(3-hydroxy-phenyl)propionate/3-hydroxycinnamic acid hydroxylase [Acidimicrobiia bacterium]
MNQGRDTGPGLDLLVVGGGPVGVAMGLFAVRHGLSATVVERVPEVYNKARAIGMDDEIVRLFQTVELAEEILDITTPIHGAEFVDPEGNRLTGIELPPGTLTPLGHPPMNMYFQPTLEALLRERAVEAGVDLVLGHEVTGFQQTEQGVDITVRPADAAATRERSMSARWMVGADGASSGVRKMLDIGFVDLGFDQDWLVVDTELTEHVELSRLAQQICDPARPTTFVPGHDRNRRWEFQIQPDDDREEIATDARVWELLEPWIDPSNAVITRSVVYRFHSTVAAEMRVGSVFLAGDAAHQMPPFLGQGLCAGFRDVANLVWKLQAVKEHWASDRLLDTYDVERRPHVTGVAEHACDTGRLIDQLAGRVESDVGTDSGYGGSRPFPHLTTGLLEGDHPMVGRQMPQPTIDGVRFDERLGPGFAVVCGEAPTVTAAVRDRWKAIGARIVVAPDALAAIPFVGPGEVIVVRPDRVVAAVVDPEELGTATDRLLALLG